MVAHCSQLILGKVIEPAKAGELLRAKNKEESLRPPRGHSAKKEAVSRACFMEGVNFFNTTRPQASKTS